MHPSRRNLLRLHRPRTISESRNGVGIVSFSCQTVEKWDFDFPLLAYKLASVAMTDLVSLFAFTQTPAGGTGRPFLWLYHSYVIDVLGCEQPLLITAVMIRGIVARPAKCRTAVKAHLRLEAEPPAWTCRACEKWPDDFPSRLFTKGGL